MADPYKNMIPAGTVTIAAGTSTASIALTANPANRKDVLVTNTSNQIAFFKFGTSAVTAATTDTPIGANRDRVFHAGDATHVAAITSTGTANVYFTTGYGH